MIQLSMDGPNVNWSIFTNLLKQREEELPLLENACSCGLHVVSGSFQYGVKAASWEVDKVICAMWKFLEESPACRGDFITVCTVSPPLFSMKCCPTTGWKTNQLPQEQLSCGAVLWGSVVGQCWWDVLCNS